MYEDYPDGHHKLRHFLNTPFGERFELHFAGKAPQLPSGARARAQGLLFDGPTAGGDGTQGALLVDSADNGILTLAADGGTTGGSNGGMAARITSYNVCYTKLLRFSHQVKVKGMLGSAGGDQIGVGLTQLAFQ